jgi:hypothetical protein
MTLPTWCSWRFKADYLPAQFHTKAGFEHAQTLLHQKPPNKRSQLALVLGIGLAARDLARQEEVEVDDPLPGTPDHFISSELELVWVEKLIAGSDECLLSERSSKKRTAKDAEPR